MRVARSWYHSDVNTRFIGEPITVEFDRPPLYSKRPHCPDRLIWNGETFNITEVLEQWVDFGRRGRMAQNMQPEHAARAAEKGSWGVGRYFFRIQTTSGRAFEIYYDRTPRGSDHGEGQWFVRLELMGE